MSKDPNLVLICRHKDYFSEPERLRVITSLLGWKFFFFFDTVCHSLLWSVDWLSFGRKGSSFSANSAQLAVRGSCWVGDLGVSFASPLVGDLISASTSASSTSPLVEGLISSSASASSAASRVLLSDYGSVGSPVHQVGLDDLFFPGGFPHLRAKCPISKQFLHLKLRFS